MPRKKASTIVANDDIFKQALFAEAGRVFGTDNIFTGKEAEARCVGLPIRHLCLRYLFQRTTFPLSRLTMIVGKQGSAKSAFLYEVMSWHTYYGGQAFLNEAENKDSPELRNGLLQNNDACITIEAHTTDEWMGNLQKQIHLSQTLLDGTKTKPGPGRIYPFAFGVDSITAVLSEETLATIAKDGSPGRRYPIEAMKIADYLRAIPQKLSNYPFSLLCVNHLKDGQATGTGRPTKHTPGGLAPKFQETFEVELAYIKDLNYTTYEGLEVAFILRKNSAGPSRKKFTAEFIWWYEEDENGIQSQRFKWNWDAASTNTLLSFQKAGGSKWTKITDIVDLHLVTSQGKKIWSDALGISRDEPVSYTTFGMKLEENPAIIDQLHKALGIRNTPIWQPGLDYRAQLNEVALQSTSLRTDGEFEDNDHNESFEEEAE